MSIVGPRQLDVGLRVQVQQRLAQRVQPGDPHLGRARTCASRRSRRCTRRRRWPRAAPGGSRRRRSAPASRRRATGHAAERSRAGRSAGDWSATWSSVSSPYRPWLPVRNQISTLCGRVMRCSSVVESLAVDVLVAVVERSTSAWAIGTGSPSWRAMCTVRATSSHITAALTAARASLPMVNRPWLRISTAGERCPRSVSTMPRPIESSPMSANGPTGISPPNSSAISGQHARDRLAAGRPGGGVGRVGVHHAADLGHVPVDVGVRGGVARTGRSVALDQRAVEVADDHAVGGQLVVGDPAAA